MRTTEPSAFINCIKTQHQRHFYRFQCVTDDHTNMKHSRLVVKLFVLLKGLALSQPVCVREPHAGSVTSFCRPGAALTGMRGQ